MTECILTEGNVEEAFLAAPPLLSKQIYNLSIKSPRWVRDLYEVEEFPRGNGTTLQQLIIRGQMPKIERGFKEWKLLQNNTGCDPCEGPGCGYNWTQFGGTGIERKTMQLMDRDFRSPSYCIKQIQTSAHFQQIFGQTVLNLYAQIDFFKEMNIGFNYLTSLAKKFVVDSAGPKPNTQNPYSYRPLGTARISTLNIEMLERFYEYMRRMPDAVPYDVVNGSPIFSIIASHQLLGRLYRDDPNLRQDVRFSGLANDMLMKYNFMSTIRGMFIAAPVLYPRRFNYNSDIGDWIEVFPFENDIPLEVGSFTGFNPAYESATHEEVIMHGKYPFKVFFMPTETTLGENTSFGPEYSFMNAWSWINPMTDPDPFRRVGYFATSATIGLAPQYSEAIFGILVERPSIQLTAVWLPAAECPPADPACDNEVPAVGCPCPLILSYSANPVTEGNYFINLAVPLSPVPDPSDEIQFGIDTGGYITGTVVTANANGLAVEVTFPEGTDLGVCDHFTTIFCDDTLGCFATVMAYSENCDNAEYINLTLSNPIKAVTAGDDVILTLGDGTTITVDVVSVDMSQNLWVVDAGAAADACTAINQSGGIVSVCVPPTTDSSCPDCGGPTYTQCS